MKKLIFIAFAILMLVGISCEDSTPKPDCETYNYGTVVVVNKSPNALYVDVTTVQRGWNDVQYINVFQSVEYHMRPGTIYLYSASPTNYTKNLWVERTNSVSQCHSLTFSWTSGSKSATIEIDSTGNVNQVYDETNTVSRIKN